MLSLAEMQRAGRALEDARRGARLERASMTAPDELLLELSGGQDLAPGDRTRILLSCRPGFARVSEVTRSRNALPRPPGLAQYLKAHVVGARLERVGLRGQDRLLELVFAAREGRATLLLQIFGPRSNLYLLDAHGLVVASARPLADTRRDLSLGEPWRDPESGAPRAGNDRFGSVGSERLLAAIEAHYSDAEQGEGLERLERRIGKALAKARAGIEKKAGKIRDELEAGGEARTLERQGELLKANLGAVSPRASSVEGVDFETGESVTIPLDPAKSASENMQEIFRRARKAERRAHKAALELGSLEARLEELARLATELETCTSGEALEALAERPEVARLLARFAALPAGASTAAAKKVWKLGKRELPTRLVPKRYRASGGLEIWVGKNDEGNDVLTTRLARGRDLFFHLEGNPGSHVVLRVERDEPSAEALLEAAELAVHFSKARSATRASVHVAQCKDISKPAGAKPGLVYVHRGRTLQLRREPARLSRVMEARIED